jgi:hypothetical protein
MRIFKVKTDFHKSFLSLFYRMKPKWRFTYYQDYSYSRKYVIFARISNRGKRSLLSHSYLNLYEPTKTEKGILKQELER